MGTQSLLIKIIQLIDYLFLYDKNNVQLFDSSNIPLQVPEV